MTTLSQTEIDKILHSPVSLQRRNAFLEEFRVDRRKTATTEMLFKKASSFNEETSRPGPEDVVWSGFNVLLQKAPFTDLPNWGPNRPWEFAVALERHLLARLEQALREAVDGNIGEPVNRDVRAVLDAFDGMTHELKERGFPPTVFVLAGPLGTQLAVDMQKGMIANGETDLKSDLGATFRIMGTHRGLPILDIPESPLPGIYAVDLSRFAKLTRYGREPVFELEEIGASRAKELLARNPHIVADPPPGSNHEAERIGQLQLKVGLQLFETYDLSVLDNNAVVGSPLVGPVLEWRPDYYR